MSRIPPASKAFAGYDDHDACVRDNQDKEDPDAFCAWLAEEGKDALTDPNADKVLTSLTTEFVSSVDTPAQDSEWLLFKDATTPRQKAAHVERPYVFAEPEDVAEKAADVDVREPNEDGERQIAYAAVLIPNDVDKQGDVIPPYVVERAAHEYMAKYRKMDSDHDLEDGAGVPVESWILKDEQDFDLPDGGTVTYPEGAWVIGKRFVDDEWARVKAGELTGFSIYGGANAVEVDDLIDEVEAVNRQATKNATGAPDEKMKQALQAAKNSDTPAATLADRVQKAEIPDEDAAWLVETLRGTAEVLEDAVEGEIDEIVDAEDEYGEDDDDEDEDDGDDDGDVSQSTKDDSNNDTMSDANDTDDGTTGGDGLPDDTPEWAKSIHETAKSTEDAVGGIRDDVESLRGRVDDLEKEVDEDPAPGNDRLSEDENDRMKSVAKDAATEAAKETVAEIAGVDPDEADEDPEVVRKGLREQVGGPNGGSRTGTGDSVDLPDESYDGVVGDGGDTVSKSSGSGGAHGNKRFAGGDD